MRRRGYRYATRMRRDAQDLDPNCVRQVVSTMGTTTLEDVAAAAPDPSQHMFQLYVIKDREFTRQLVQARTVHVQVLALEPVTLSVICLHGFTMTDNILRGSKR